MHPLLKDSRAACRFPLMMKPCPPFRVEVCIEQHPGWIDQFVHELTVAETSLEGLRNGRTKWIATVDNAAVTLSWDWVELMADVIALADPTNIQCSATLVTRDGEPASDNDVMLTLSHLVSSLPWQDHVLRHLARPLQ